MQTLMRPDPAKAREYFSDKMSFTIGPVELDHLLKAGGEEINLIDVREPEDYSKGHITGAINLPKTQWSSLNGLSKEKTNVVYCYTAVCHLGAAACLEFASRGFPVVELDGGFEEWKENDLDVDGGSVNRLLKQTKEKILHRH